MDELDFYDPDDDDVDLALAEYEAPKRRRKRRRNPSNPEPIAIATPLLLVAGYAGWCWWVSARKNLPWSWQPWKGIAVGRRRIPLGRPIRQNDYRAYDAAVEKMMKPSVFTVEEVDVWKKPITRDSEREVVSFIEP